MASSLSQDFSESDDLEVETHKRFTFAFFALASPIIWSAKKAGFFYCWACIALMLAYYEFHSPSFCGLLNSDGSNIRVGVDEMDPTQPVPFLRPVNMYYPCPQGLYAIQVHDPMYAGDIYYYMPVVMLLIWFFLRGIPGWTVAFLTFCIFLATTTFFGVYYTSVRYQSYQWGDDVIIVMYCIGVILSFLFWVVLSKRCHLFSLCLSKESNPWAFKLTTLRQRAIANLHHSKYSDQYLIDMKFKKISQDETQKQRDMLYLKTAGWGSSFVYYFLPCCWCRPKNEHETQPPQSDGTNKAPKPSFWNRLCCCAGEHSKELLSDCDDNVYDDDNDYNNGKFDSVRRSNQRHQSWDEECVELALMLKRFKVNHPLRVTIDHQIQYFSTQTMAISLAIILFFIAMSIQRNERTVPSNDLQVIVLHDLNHIFWVLILGFVSYSVHVENIITKQFQSTLEDCRKLSKQENVDVQPVTTIHAGAPELKTVEQQVEMGHYSLNAEDEEEEEEKEDDLLSDDEKKQFQILQSVPDLPPKRISESSIQLESQPPVIEQMIHAKEEPMIHAEEEPMIDDEEDIYEGREDFENTETQKSLVIDQLKTALGDSQHRTQNNDDDDDDDNDDQL